MRQKFKFIFITVFLLLPMALSAACQVKKEFRIYDSCQFLQNFGSSKESLKSQLNTFCSGLTKKRMCMACNGATKNACSLLGCIIYLNDKTKVNSCLVRSMKVEFSRNYDDYSSLASSFSYYADPSAIVASTDSTDSTDNDVDEEEEEIISGIEYIGVDEQEVSTRIRQLRNVSQANQDKFAGLNHKFHSQYKPDSVKESSVIDNFYSFILDEEEVLVSKDGKYVISQSKDESGIDIFKSYEVDKEKPALDIKRDSIYYENGIDKTVANSFIDRLKFTPTTIMKSAFLDFYRIYKPDSMSSVSNLVSKDRKFILGDWSNVFYINGTDAQSIWELDENKLRLSYLNDNADNMITVSSGRVKYPEDIYIMVNFNSSSVPILGEEARKEFLDSDFRINYILSPTGDKLFRSVSEKDIKGLPNRGQESKLKEMAANILCAASHQRLSWLLKYLRYGDYTLTQQTCNLEQVSQIEKLIRNAGLSASRKVIFKDGRLDNSNAETAEDIIANSY